MQRRECIERCVTAFSSDENSCLCDQMRVRARCFVGAAWGRTALTRRSQRARREACRGLKSLSIGGIVAWRSETSLNAEDAEVRRGLQNGHGTATETATDTAKCN